MNDPTNAGDPLTDTDNIYTYTDDNTLYSKC